MVFSSLFFIYFFLPLNLIFYHRAKNLPTQNKIMLTFSLIFYSWNGPQYLILILLMTFISWLAGLAITRYDQVRKILLCVAIGSLLAILAFFKYTGFFLETINFISPLNLKIPNIVLPIGISFYTFQLISYVVDVYRGEVRPQTRYANLLLYASLFHQCIAGPIVRYKDIANDIFNRKIYMSEVKEGIKRFCYGLAKKAILANGLATIADRYLVTDELKALVNQPATGLWLGSLAFCLQIYFDFSAYSDMAIGMGLMTGFHYKENFNYPYVARSITDFWRRWHISLSNFFRDYVYIPLGGNRHGNVYLNLLVVWFLTGMWHGASWNYILWGLYYYFFICLEKKHLADKLEAWPKAISRLYTMSIVIFGWVLFKFENLEFLARAISGLFCLNGNAFSNTQVYLSLKNNIFLFLFAFLAAGKTFGNLQNKLIQRYSDRMFFRKTLYFYEAITPWILLILSSLSLIGNSYNPFLYFQF